MESIPRISRSHAEMLGHYVYVYYDSETREPFYIGRGQNDRVLSHASHSHSDLVRQRIEQGGYGFDILAHGLDQETAKKVEAASIDLVGIEHLLNKSRGAGAVAYGRVNALTLLRSLDAEPLAEVHHNLIVVSINETYRVYGDDPEALYESTRGVWAQISASKANAAEYIVGVVEGRIVYVMTAAAWLPAGSTNYFIRDGGDEEGRIEFVGRTASPEILDLYEGRTVQAGQRPTYLGPFHDKVYLVNNQWQPQAPWAE